MTCIRLSKDANGCTGWTSSEISSYNSPNKFQCNLPRTDLFRYSSSNSGGRTFGQEVQALIYAFILWTSWKKYIIKKYGPRSYRHVKSSRNSECWNTLLTNEWKTIHSLRCSTVKFKLEFERDFCTTTWGIAFENAAKNCTYILTYLLTYSYIHASLCVLHIFVKSKKNKAITVNRSWRIIGVWGVKTFTISSQLSHKQRWDCQALRAGRPLPSGIFLVLIFVRGWVDPRATVWMEELSTEKSPTTSSGIEPVIFQFVA
jgi:hypothetical protein